MSGVDHWVIYNRPRMNPERQGPFSRNSSDIEVVLRKLYAEIPGVNCSVVTVSFGDVDVKGGLWWLETVAEASSIEIAPSPGASLASTAGRRFNQLEWVRSLWDPDRPDRPQFKASFGDLKFHVVRNDNGTWGYGVNNRYDSEAAAKEAAQADFERHLLPALAPDDGPPHDDIVAGFVSAVKADLSRRLAANGSALLDPELYPAARLSRGLVESVERHGPVEVGVFAALLHRRGMGIANDRERYADMKTEERAKADAQARAEGRDPDAERAAAAEQAKRDLAKAYGGVSKVRKGKRR
ncbi:hypothetical protein [Rhizobium leguminosarum]|uniref:hypothetical protein n=1 Tax=Rhizobium leguminosarum TaxID=384 RepID=UPI002E112E88|nr:hypothetical protein U8Q02_40940 [Rhizobium leguminosarum]